MSTETETFDLVVWTDKADYAPGEYATFTVSGVPEGGTIKLQVQHVTDPGADGSYGTLDDVLDAGPDGETGTEDDGYGTTGAGHEPFYVTDGGEGDLDGVANGTIVTEWYVNPDDSLNETFLLTATDTSTGEVATTSFTDSGGAYTINFAAADPSIYLPPIPFPADLTAPIGRSDGDLLIPSAEFNNGTVDVLVESLAPQDMALGQIVPFETKITVNGTTTPEDGVITFVIGWNTLTSNGDDFGFDARTDDVGYGVIGAFIDTGDGAFTDANNDATVDSFTWSLINDEIVGIFTVSGLDDGDEVVLESWLVLDDTIGAGVGGRVGSRLIDGATGSDQTINVANSGAITLVNGDSISTGNQLVPLLQPGSFLTADVDLSVTKTDDVDPIAPGETLTYTITASNAGPSVANTVVVYDELDPNVTFVSASDGGFINTDSGDSIPDGAVQWDVGALAPGDSVEYTVAVTVNNDAPTAGDEDLTNTVTITTISDDIVTTNNTATETTDVSAPANILDDLDESVTTNEDTPVSGNVLDNTDNPDGGPASVTTFQVAGDATVYNAGDTATITGVGTLVIGSDGAYTFTPAEDYDGAVPQTTYTVSDGIDTNDSTLDITITPVNDLDDLDESVTTNEDTPVSGNVLDNVVNPDGGPESITTFQVDGDATVYNAGDTATIAGVGTLVIGSDGAYTFTPEPNYDGAVPQTTYTVTDGIDTNDSTLDITITPVNDLDDLDESVTTNEDTPVSGNVLDNTDNPDGGPASVTTFQVAGDATVYNAGDTATITGVGTLVIGSDGAYTFTPAEDYDGAVPQTTYTVSDGIDTNDSTLDIAITPVNDLDDLDESVTTNEDTPVSGNVLDNVVNPDGGPESITTFQVDGDATVYNAGDTATIAGVGTLVIGSDGAYTFTPEPNYDGAVPQTTYTVTDGIDTNDSTLDITITPVNDLDDLDESVTTNEDTPVSGNVLDNTDNPDGGPASVTTFQVAGDATVYNAGDTATITGVGTLVIGNDGAYTFTPAEDYDGAVPQTTYTVSDGIDTNDSTLDIAITPVNDLDDLDESVTTNEDTPVSGNVLDNVVNPDGGPESITTFQVDGDATVYNAGDTATIAGVGTLVIGSDGAYTFTPEPNYDGAVPQTTYTVTDGIDTNDSTLDIAITPVNDLDDLDESVTTNEDTPVSGNVLDNVVNPDGGPESITTFQVDGDATVYNAGDTATIAGVGTLVIGSDGSYTFTPADDYNGPVPQTTYTVTDGADTNDSTLDISITPVNDLPTAADDSYTVEENSGTTTLTPAVTADDDFGGDGPSTGTIAIATNPTSGTVTVNDGGTPNDPTDDTFDYTPNDDFSGSDSFTYTITDADGDTSAATVDITVDPVAISIIKEGTFEDDGADGMAGTLDEGEGDGFANVGETISYDFTVANEGNVTLTDVTVVDEIGGVTIDGGPTTLDVGETDTTTFTGSYTLTQADIDTGEFENQALASGTSPIGNTVTDLSDDELANEDDPTVTPAPQNGVISIVKAGTWNDFGEDGLAGTGDEGEGDGFANVGETITYAFTVANEGNVTLTNVMVEDEGITVSGGPIASLAVGASDSTTFTGSYTLTQDDIDAGEFENQALATGTYTDPIDGPQDVTDDSDSANPVDDTGGEDDPTVTPAPQNGVISIVKAGTWNDFGEDGLAGTGDEGEGDGFANVGETITYAFTVANEGNVTLTNVMVEDEGITVSGGPIASLGVGASDSTTFEGSYTLTQADIDAGKFENQALATGTYIDPIDGPQDVTDDSDSANPVDDTGGEDDPTVTPAPQNGVISIVKAGTWNDFGEDGLAGTGDEGEGDGFANVGETITYAFTVANEGNVTLTNVMVEDEGITVSGGPIASLGVGASDSTTFTGSYTLTQDDIDAGEFENQALATGTYIDPIDGPQDVTDDSDSANPVDDTGGEDDPTVTPAPQNGVISIVKAGTWNDFGEDGLAGTGDEGEGDGFANVGETITYAFTVANEGNVTLTNVMVEDEGITVSGGPIASLAVGASDSTTFTGSYTLTQDDIDAGEFENQALATGTYTDPIDGPQDVTDDSDSANPVDDTGGEDDPTVTPAPQNGVISIVKAGTWNDFGEDGLADTGDEGEGDGFANVGETITYAFTVANEGNVTLTNVMVEDEGITVSGGPIASLAVGASDSTTFTGSYTLTQDDIDAGEFENQALATGTYTDPIDGPQDVTDDSDSNDPLLEGEDDPTVTPAPQNGVISIVKAGTWNDFGEDGLAGTGDEGEGDGFANVGETITYAFTVANEGNVTLTNVTVEDDGITVSGGPIASLAVGASDSTTFTGSYTLTQDDIDAGEFENQALATGTYTDPIDGPQDVTDDSDSNDPLLEGEDDPTVTPVPQNGAISIVKDFAGSGDEFVIAGDEAGSSFTLVVSNDGNVTLSDGLVLDEVDTRLEVSGLTLPTDWIDLDNDGDDDTGDGDPQTIEVSFATLSPGDSETITVNFEVDASVPEAKGVGGINGGGNVLNEADVAAEAPLGDPGYTGDDIIDDDQDDIDILTEIDLSIDKTFYRIEDFDTATTNDDTRVEDGVIEQGTTGYFELTVTNSGPSDALDVLVTDTVSPSLEVVRVFNDLNNNDIWDAGEELADFDGDGIGDFGASTGQNIEGTFDLAAGGDTATISVEYEAAPFLDPEVSLYGTQEGDDFKFTFVNGYTLEGSSDPNSKAHDNDGLHEVFLTAPDGTVTEIVYDGTKNEYNFDPPELELYENGSLVLDENGAPVLFDDPEFTLHLSCSDPFTGGWGSGGANGPEDGVDANWQISSHSILRYNNNGNFFKGCGDTVVPADVPNTAFADAADSNSLLGTDELVSSSDTVQVIRQLKIDTRSDLTFKGKKADILLFNTGNEALTIKEIQIDWPDGGGKDGNGNLVEVLFGNNTIYDTREATSGAILDDDDGDGSSWVGTLDDRTIEAREGLKLQFFFAKKVYADGPYEITVTLEGELTSEVLNITANQSALTLDAEPLTGGDAELLTQSTLAPATLAAMDYWAGQGEDAESLEMLLKTDIRIEDLGGSLLGQTSGLTVTLDDDAAGYGWSESLGAVDADEIDLLSVLTHEFGHVLGYDHDTMGDTLAVGERDLPNDDGFDYTNLSGLDIQADLLFV